MDLDDEMPDLAGLERARMGMLNDLILDIEIGYRIGQKRTWRPRA